MDLIVLFHEWGAYSEYGKTILGVYSDEPAAQAAAGILIRRKVAELTQKIERSRAAVYEPHPKSRFWPSEAEWLARGERHRGWWQGELDEIQRNNWHDGRFVVNADEKDYYRTARYTLDTDPDAGQDQILDGWGPD